MSLARIAIRTAAVEALKGRTLVGNNVLDSEIGVIDVDSNGNAVTTEKSPFTAIYTDAAKADVGENELRSLFLNGTTEVLFESGVTAAMTGIDPKTGENVLGIGVLDTDANFEFQLDLLARQIIDALTDPGNEWGQVFLGLCYRIASVERVRTGNVSDGVRLAAQQMKLTVLLVDDPEPRRALIAGTPFARFVDLAKASTDESTQKKGAFIEAVSVGSYEAWEHLQRSHGMTADELLALGLGPLASDVDRATPDMAEGALEIEGVPPPRKVP
ncbi:hypothetical protein FG152_09745 [Ochrobactrum sp. XJ1]|nr:hypothetical protein [Ochrobactrum sp. XJ1]